MRAHYEELWAEHGWKLAVTPPDPARERFMFSSAELAPGRRVLDLGCGSGPYSEALSAAGLDVTAAETAQAALDLVAARPRFGGRLQRVEPDTALPIEDCSFDLVWACEVAEHVADTQLWFSEIRRVLAPNGVLALTTPANTTLGRTATALVAFDRAYDVRGDHLRFFTKRSLRELLQDFGFNELTLSLREGPPLLRRSLFISAARA